MAGASSPAPKLRNRSVRLSCRYSVDQLPSPPRPSAEKSRRAPQLAGFSLGAAVTGPREPGRGAMFVGGAWPISYSIRREPFFGVVEARAARTLRDSPSTHVLLPPCLGGTRHFSGAQQGPIFVPPGGRFLVFDSRRASPRISAPGWLKCSQLFFGRRELWLRRLGGREMLRVRCAAPVASP